MLSSLLDQDKRKKSHVTETGDYVIVSTCNNAEENNEVDFHLLDNEERHIIPYEDNTHSATIIDSKVGAEKVTADQDNSLENTKIVKDEFVYRVLRIDETIEGGLYPKNIYAKKSVQEHVEDGSNYFFRSQYISCCKTLDGVICLAGSTNNQHCLRDVVCINIAKLKDVTVIDLTNPNTLKQHVEYKSKAWNFAQKYDEVLLEPISHIPFECVAKVGYVRNRIFYKF